MNLFSTKYLAKTISFFYRDNTMTNVKYLTNSHDFVRVLILVLFMVVSFFVIYRQTLSLYFSQFKMALTMIHEDDMRGTHAELIYSQMEYRMHEMEMAYTQKWCKKYPPKEKRVAWLTAMMNDKYVVGAVYLAYTLKKLSCHHEMIALVSNGVTAKSQQALRTAGFNVREVESLDCDWMDRKQHRKERHKFKPGTHMRFHAWNYTEYKKILYLDPDVMPLSNIDEVFNLGTEIGAVHTRKPGIIREGFNAGFLLFTPGEKSYINIMKEWELVGQDCPNDQMLLNTIYDETWYEIPFPFNARMNIFPHDRNHLYHPIKVFHFTTPKLKPWQPGNVPARKLVKNFNGPLLTTNDVYLLWWRHYFAALKEMKLESWFNDIKASL